MISKLEDIEIKLYKIKHRKRTRKRISELYGNFEEPNIYVIRLSKKKYEERRNRKKKFKKKWLKFFQI